MAQAQPIPTTAELRYLARQEEQRRAEQQAAADALASEKWNAYNQAVRERQAQTTGLLHEPSAIRVGAFGQEGRPNLRQVMDALSLDSKTASTLLYGLAPDVDLRNWNAILASGDPSGARQGLIDQYGGLKVVNGVTNAEGRKIDQLISGNTGEVLRQREIPGMATRYAGFTPAPTTDENRFSGFSLPASFTNHILTDDTRGYENVQHNLTPDQYKAQYGDMPMDQRAVQARDNLYAKAWNQKDPLYSSYMEAENAADTFRGQTPVPFSLPTGAPDSFNWTPMAEGANPFPSAPTFSWGGQTYQPSGLPNGPATPETPAIGSLASVTGPGNMAYSWGNWGRQPQQQSGGAAPFGGPAFANNSMVVGQPGQGFKSGSFGGPWGGANPWRLSA